jgi:NAD(P) transhydrogenase subunit alpha
MMPSLMAWVTNGFGLATGLADGTQTTEASGGGLGMLILSLTILVLAIFVGFEVISKVPPTLHTPLMSGSNAISGITVVGAIFCAGSSSPLAQWLGLAAVVIAIVNVVGGFLVTHRMLQMFKKKK